MSNFTAIKTASGYPKRSVSNYGQRALLFPLFKGKVSLLLLVLLINLCSFAQTNLANNKIDPAFRYIIEATKTKTFTDKSSWPTSSRRIVPTKGIALPGSNAEDRYECIVYTKDAKTLSDSGIILNTALPTFVTAWVTLDQIERLAEMQQVEYVEAPRFLRALNDISAATSGASLLHRGALNNTVYKGKNVIVAIFDSGIDWKHLDFRRPDDTTKSRILWLWDQTITPGSGETAPSGFSYGVEYSQSEINDEIDGTPANFVREVDTEGHGTHVAGTAAGNGQALASGKYMGIAPESDLIVIKGGDSTFDDTRMIDAISYVQQLSTTLGRPVVLNLSVGSLFGPHDGTRPTEVAIDNFTSSAPGRVAAVVAGNDNGSRKHNRLTLSPNGTGSVSFSVPSGTEGTDIFEYRIYANTNGSISARFTAPGGGTVSAGAGQSTNGNVLNNAFTVSLSNQVDPSNNNRYVDIDVVRRNSNTTDPAGTWTLTLTNNTASTLTLDGWLHEVGSNYSGTSINDGDNNYLVNSPGNATSAITVGSYIFRNSWRTAEGSGRTYPGSREDSIAPTSSQGPRRDNVLKPEIAAVGQAVISALSSQIDNADPNFVIEEGKYILQSGTSMATPGVSGALALLLQANSTATAAQLKNLITTTALKDGMTELPGTTPNPVWGHGKLDVFKAASSLFNCGPAERKTYRYDSLTRNPEQTNVRLTTQRPGVRFTPDITGKLGGLYFYSAELATNLLLDVRTYNAGRPDALLGTLAVPADSILPTSWNYFDLSALNISVTSGIDYFVIAYRDPMSMEEWTIGAEELLVNNRSITSFNGGTNWVSAPANYKMRSVVYNNSQLAGTIATVTSADTTNTNSSNQFINTNCQLIAQVVANGANPVTGTITGKVWLEGSIPTNNNIPYVQRHYEILPAAGSGDATARVTLFFTQGEFNNFNVNSLSILDLPFNTTDAAGKANIRVIMYRGTSSDNSGTPGSYTGTPTIIDPTDENISWNPQLNRWEISFDVTGFGGFIVQTDLTALPIVLEYFKGERVGKSNDLTWKANCTNTSAIFDIERSKEGRLFETIGNINSAQIRCLQPFDFTDASPLPNQNYYRIKITENTGRTFYSNTILLQSNNSITSVYPTIIQRGSAIQVSYEGTKGHFIVTDISGRQVCKMIVTNGVQSLSLPTLTSGTYLYTIRNDNAIVKSGKIVVQ